MELHSLINGALNVASILRHAPVIEEGTIVYKTECTFTSKTNIPFTVREVGLGRNSYTLGAMARIADQTNTPMEVRVLEDQFLKVTYRIVIGAAALNNRISFGITLGGVTKTFTAALGISKCKRAFNAPLLPRAPGATRELWATLAVINTNSSGVTVISKEAISFAPQPMVTTYNSVLDILSCKGRYLLDLFSTTPYNHVLQAIDLTYGTPYGIAFGLFDIKSEEFPYGIPIIGNRAVFDYNYTLNLMRDI
jgi:hypothetical protein